MTKSAAVIWKINAIVQFTIPGLLWEVIPIRQISARRHVGKQTFFQREYKSIKIDGMSSVVHVSLHIMVYTTVSSFNMLSQSCITLSNVITIITGKRRHSPALIFVKTKACFSAINFPAVTPKNGIIICIVCHLVWSISRSWFCCSYVRWHCFGFRIHFVKYCRYWLHGTDFFFVNFVKAFLVYDIVCKRKYILKLDKEILLVRRQNRNFAKLIWIRNQW